MSERLYSLRFPSLVRGGFAVWVIVCMLVPIQASADPFLDDVVEFIRPPGSSDQGGLAIDALGAPDNAFVSIDIPEILTLRFSDNYAFDGPGDDLQFFTVVEGDSNINVWASADGSSYVELATFNTDFTIDLSAFVGLDEVRFLEFRGLDNGGSAAGYELDAVEALNSIPEPSTALLLATGLVGLAMSRRRVQLA